jgi:hypothetical protein
VSYRTAPAPTAAPARGRRRLGAAQARARANAWLALYRPGSIAGEVTRLHRAFAVEVRERGNLAGVLSVDVRTGSLLLQSREPAISA